MGRNTVGSGLKTSCGREQRKVPPTASISVVMLDGEKTHRKSFSYFLRKKGEVMANDLQKDSSIRSSSIIFKNPFFVFRE